MQTWFEVKVKYVKVDQDGRERKVGEVYLIDAVSFTDAEARTIEQMQQVIRGEFHIDNIKKSNIVEIFPHEDGEYWYKAKITLITIDEKAGKEKKTNNYFLVAADDFKQAFLRLEEGLSYILVPYNTTAMALSTIVDVFPYFKDDQPVIPPHLKRIEPEDEPIAETSVAVESDDEEEQESFEAPVEPVAESEFESQTEEE